jgi:hypothetical protein
MAQDYSLISSLVGWLPMLLLVGVWLFFLRQVKRGKYNPNKAIAEQQIQELQRQNAILERIARALERET